MSEPPWFDHAGGPLPERAAARARRAAAVPREWQGMCAVDLDHWPVDAHQSLIERAIVKLLSDLPADETWDWTSLKIRVIEHVPQGPPAVSIRIKTRERTNDAEGN